MPWQARRDHEGATPARRANLPMALLMLAMAGCSGAAPSKQPMEVDDASALRDAEPEPDAAEPLDAAGDAPEPEEDAAPADEPDADAPDAAPDAAKPEPRQVDGLLVLVDGETGSLKQPTTAAVQKHDAARSSTCSNPWRTLPLATGPAQPREGKRYIVSELQQSWFSDPNTYCGMTRYGGDTLSLLGQPDGSTNLADDARYWIGWSVLIPEDSPTPAADNWWVFAIHDAPGGSGTDILRLLLTPTLSWRVSFYDTSMHTLDFGEPALGVWQDFVAEVVMSRSPEQGLFRLWHRVGEGDFRQVDDYHGATATDGSPPWMLFFGLYVLSYRDTAPARRILLDEIRIADERGSLELVAPGSRTLPRE